MRCNSPCLRDNQVKNIPWAKERWPWCHGRRSTKALAESYFGVLDRLVFVYKRARVSPYPVALTFWLPLMLGVARQEAYLLGKDEAIFRLSFNELCSSLNC